LTGLGLSRKQINAADGILIYGSATIEGLARPSVSAVLNLRSTEGWVMQAMRASRREFTGAAGSGCGARHVSSARPPLRTLVATLIVLLGCTRMAAAAAPEAGYRFGVFPYLPALAIDEVFGPLAARFARDLENPVRLKTKSTFELFAQELAEQSYDIILVHPFFYIDSADHYNYRPLARVDDELTAVVVVPEGRPWDDWQDLQGGTLALPPALSAVSEMVEAALREHGLTPDRDVTLRHYATKMACLHAAVFGAADGCALPAFILSQLGAIAEMKLRVMAKTAPIKHFVLAVHTRVPMADRARLLRSLLDLPDSADGQAILAATAWPGFVAVQDDEYDDVRRYRARKRTLAQR
jgi:ABC-type phosphate/phosphonate transport system substrate-binding protein